MDKPAIGLSKGLHSSLEIPRSVASVMHWKHIYLPASLFIRSLIDLSRFQGKFLVLKLEMGPVRGALHLHLT